MSDERALRWIVTGRVQGVSYRFFTRDEAARLGLVGWVKNLPDGSVEVRLRGPSEKIETLRRRLSQGPPLARVDGISEEELAAGASLPEGFDIRF